MTVYELTYRFEAPTDVAAFQAATRVGESLDIQPGLKLERLSRVLVTHMPLHSEEPGPPDWQRGPQGRDSSTSDSEDRTLHSVCEPQWNEDSQEHESTCVCGWFAHGQDHGAIEEAGRQHALAANLIEPEIQHEVSTPLWSSTFDKYVSVCSCGWVVINKDPKRVKELAEQHVLHPAHDDRWHPDET